MDSSVFHIKMNDLKQKLSSINDDIIEIKKNRKKANKKKIISKNERSPIKSEQNIFQNNQMLITIHNNSINEEKPYESFLNKEAILKLNNISDSPKLTPNKTKLINNKYYKDLEQKKEINRIKKLNRKLIYETNYDYMNKNNLKDRLTYSNILNEDKEMSFRKLNDENLIGNNNKYKCSLNASNPISLKAKKRNNPYSINNLNQGKALNIIRNIINHKYNENLVFKNNNTISIAWDDKETIQRERKILHKKIIPISQKNKLKSNNLKFFSIISPKKKNILKKEAIYFDNNLNKNNKLNNLSNDYEIIRNETQTPIPCNKNSRMGGIYSKGELYYSGILLGTKKFADNKGNNNIKNNDSNDLIQIRSKIRTNLNKFKNKERFNSKSYNRLIIDGNILQTDRSNKLLRNRARKFNISDNFININSTFDTEKLINKINKQIVSNRKKNSSFKNLKILSYKSFGNIKGEKNKYKLSPNKIIKLNQNIIDSKIKNNFIKKLMHLYNESTGLNLNRENDLNTNLNILYIWIDNLNKKNYPDNKKLNEEIQYKILRTKIMNQYQLKNKSELKTFLNKVIGKDT